MIIKYWREILIVILIIVAGLAMRSYKVSESDKQVLLNSRDSSFLVARYYRNKYDESVGQVKMQEVTVRQLKEYGEELGINNKRLKSQVGNLNNLVGQWKAKASAKDTITIHTTDTIYKDNGVVFDRAFSWSGKYMSLDGMFSLSSNLVAINYNYTPEFTLTAYYKPNPFYKPFAKQQLVADIQFDDPNIKVSSFQGLLITPDPPVFYQRTWFKMSVGFALGFFAAKQL